MWLADEECMGVIKQMEKAATVQHWHPWVSLVLIHLESFEMPDAVDNLLEVGCTSLSTEMC